LPFQHVLAISLYRKLSELSYLGTFQKFLHHLRLQICRLLGVYLAILEFQMLCL